MHAPAAPIEGEIIAGKYRVERVLGAGGMGVVFAAWHLQLNQRVALKFLRAETYRDPDAVARFLREAQALARITSPHVARVMDVGTLEHGEPYLVMEHLSGSDLRAVLRDRGRLSIPEAVSYLLQVGEAIAEAHATGIVHRDLKPSNLFLTHGADGQAVVKVLDFGISKALPLDGVQSKSRETNTGALVGSPEYMSPEQIRNAKRVDGRSDIWALGVILHELLSGEAPFRGESVAGTLAAIAADAPVPIRRLRPEVPPGLESAILRCLEKSLERRFASVAQLARALLDFAPEEARASVARIARISEGSAREAARASSARPGLEVRTLASGTVRTWEGLTSTTLRSNARSRRALLALGLGLLVAALVGASAFFRANRSQPGSANAALPSAPSRASAVAQVNGALPAPPARNPALPAVPAAPSASASAGPGIDESALVKPRTPVRALRPARPAGDDDGTNERK
jgi:serine/threonine-protein kinase